MTRHVSNPYAVADRVKLSTKRRVELFLEHGGICCVCSMKIVGRFICEHVKPLWDWPEGTPKEVANAWDNLGPACIKCARKKTDEEATARSKLRRTVAKNIGAYRSKNPMPCGKLSRFKKRMDGTVVLRSEE